MDKYKWKEKLDRNIQTRPPKPCSHCGIMFDGAHFCIGSSQQDGESDEEYEMRMKQRSDTNE